MQASPSPTQPNTNPMDIERYLMAVTTALRDDVLPTLPPSTARDQVINSLRVLARVRIGLGTTAHEARAASEDMNLPLDIRQAFAASVVTAPALAEEVAVNATTSTGMLAASAWLANESWNDNIDQLNIARALLAHESEWRNARLAHMEAAEIPNPGAAASISSGSKLTEATLLEYLRRRLNKPKMKIDGYRLLPGGRTRKTALFKQTGIEDWPEWVVVQCDPPVGYHSFPGVVSQFPVLEYLYPMGTLRSPRPLLMELDPEPFGTPFMIVERMPGTPPGVGINFFAPPPRSESLALSHAQQMGVLHSVAIEPVAKSIPNLLPTKGWSSDLDKLIATIGERFHGPSLAISAAFAWMRRNVHHVRETVSLVHGDVLQQNLLTEGDAVTAILDWEAIRVGHPGEDLGYARPMIEQMTTWDRYMETYFNSGGPQFSQAEGDYFTLRAYILMLTHIAGSRNAFEEGRVDDIRAAEVGCSLAPLFINCVSQTLDKILAREAAAK